METAAKMSHQANATEIYKQKLATTPVASSTLMSVKTIPKHGLMRKFHHANNDKNCTSTKNEAYHKQMKRRWVSVRTARFLRK